MIRMLLLVLALLCAVVVAAPCAADGVSTAAVGSEYDWSGFGTLEGVACKPLAPTTIDIGAGIGVQITTVPAGWWMVGGRKLYINGIALTTGELCYGGSMSLQPAPQDDGFRVGMCYGGDVGVQVWLGKAIAYSW